MSRKYSEHFRRKDSRTKQSETLQSFFQCLGSHGVLASPCPFNSLHMLISNNKRSPHKCIRCHSSGCRCLQWIDACLSMVTSNADLSTSALAAVAGANSKEERARAAAAAAERPVAGVHKRSCALTGVMLVQTLPFLISCEHCNNITLMRERNIPLHGTSNRSTVNRARHC